MAANAAAVPNDRADSELCWATVSRYVGTYVMLRKYVADPTVEIRNATKTACGACVKTWRSGERDDSCAVDLFFSKVEVSSIWCRNGIISSAKAPPTAKRMRQPYACIVSSASVRARIVLSPTASNAPTSEFAAAQLAASPRLRAVAVSMR